MSIYIHDRNWMTDAITADAIIIPAPGRATFFGDRNLSVIERYKAIPGSFKWFIHNYIGRKSPDSYNAVMHNVGGITAGQNFAKVMSSGVRNVHIANEAKACKDFGDQYFKMLPKVIGVSVCNSFNNFDTHASAKADNFSISKDHKDIESIIQRAVCEALGEVKNIQKPNIYFAPLFREEGYYPTEHTGGKPSNPNWRGLDYINSVLLALEPYRFDHVNLHIFHRSFPYKPEDIDV